MTDTDRKTICCQCKCVYSNTVCVCVSCYIICESGICFRNGRFKPCRRKMFEGTRSQQQYELMRETDRERDGEQCCLPLRTVAERAAVNHQTAQTYQHTHTHTLRVVIFEWFTELWRPFICNSSIYEQCDAWMMLFHLSSATFNPCCH